MPYEIFHMAYEIWTIELIAKHFPDRLLNSYFLLQGISSDLYHSVTALILYCWMAPAGSTFFGQTLVHSPLNVQPQMPSCCERTSRRSLAPWSRVSLLYRWASAMAAGPMKCWSRPTTGHAA